MVSASAAGLATLLQAHVYQRRDVAVRRVLQPFRQTEIPFFPIVLDHVIRQPLMLLLGETKSGYLVYSASEM